MTRIWLAGRPGGRRETIRAHLASPPFEVVGASASVADALASEADVVLSIDGDSAGAAAEDDAAPGLVVLGNDDVVPLVAASGHAAWAVVSPLATGTELRAAVSAVAAGLVVIPPAAARSLGRRPSVEGEEDADGEALTPRELEVLELASHGRSNRDVAAALGISEHTVKFHLASIYGKLGAGSRTEAVRRGLRRGLITM